MRSEHASKTVKQVSFRGYTLIETVVVVTIIGILAGMLLPVLSSVQRRMVRTRCCNNVKQINLALIVFATDHAMKYPWVIGKRDQAQMGFTYFGAFDTQELYGNAIIRCMLGTSQVLVSPHDPDRKLANDKFSPGYRFVDFVPSGVTSYGIAVGSPLATGPAQEFCADHSHTQTIITMTRNIVGPINDGDSLSDQSGGNPVAAPGTPKTDYTRRAHWVGVDDPTRKSPGLKGDRAMANLKGGAGQLGLADGSARLSSLSDLSEQIKKHHLDEGPNYRGTPSPIIDTPNDAIPGRHSDYHAWKAALPATP